MSQHVKLYYKSLCEERNIEPNKQSTFMTTCLNSAYKLFDDAIPHKKIIQFQNSDPKYLGNKTS